jgi:lipoprotein-anchoring transpeptidase ErfK/SrfK
MKTIKIVFSISLVLFGLALAFFFTHGGKRVFAAITVSYEVDSVRTPTDPIMIRFSEPVDAESFAGKISVTPDIPLAYAWSDDRKILSLKPQSRWVPGGQYRLFVGSGKAKYGKNVPIVSTSFRIPGYPNIVSMTPAAGTKDVLLGIEDPMIVRFDRPVGDFYIDFRLTPDLPVVYENDDDKEEFRLMPKNAMKPGTEYELSVYAKWRGEGDDRYVRLDSTRFTTLPERPKEWNKDLALRIEEAKRFARPLLASGKYIDIDIGSQVMTIFENGRLLDAYLVSSGLRGMDTPKGNYKIENKAKRPWSKKYELYMPNWMAITSDGKFGIHELPEWPSGYKEGANHLGIPVSHGCVRLGVGPAKRVFDWADIGTPVIVH